MPVWIYIAAFLVGSYMKYDDNKKTAKRTQSAIEEGYRRQKEKNQERKDRTMAYADETIDQTEQNEQLAEYQDRQEESIMEQTDERMADVESPVSGSGYISSDAAKLADSERLNTLKQLSEMASLKAKTRGFGDLNFGNTVEERGMAGDVAGINTEANIMGNTDELLTKIASQPDATKQFMGGLLQQLGMMGGMNAMATTGPSTGFIGSNLHAAPPAAFTTPLPYESQIYKTMLLPPAKVGPAIPRQMPVNGIPIK
jgi:hypothetical protein